MSRTTETDRARAPADPSSRAAQLELARAHVERRAWEDAYALLSVVDEEAPVEGEALELLVSSAVLTGRDEEHFKAAERLYQAHCRDGETAKAALVAFWAGFRMMFAGEAGRASGWLSRAQRLVEQDEDCVVRGYLMLPVVRRHLTVGDFESAERTAAEAGRIGERAKDLDLVMFARNLEGRVLLRAGKVERGLELLDEVMLAATSGELSPAVTGLVYCSAIDGCHRIFALDRTREWTAALERWCESQPQLFPFTSACRVDRALTLQLGGSWREALDEARRAAKRSEAGALPEAGGEAFYQQAEIHRLRGEMERAEATYGNASELGRDPQPGLALLRLAQGHPDRALATIRRALGATNDSLERLRFLPAHVEIALAANEVAEAAKASRELESISDRYGMDVIGAIAAHARGAVQLAEGDAVAAVAPLRHALTVWHRVPAPYIVARIRIVLARAYSELGDEDGAAMELTAARQVFEQLGAARDAAAVDALQRKSRAPSSAHGLTDRELQVLRLVASGKTNKLIAGELGLSEKTVDRHVSNIFAKVNVASRTAATAFAYEHGLV